MKVAITSVVVLEVPDRIAQRYDTEALKREFKAANEYAKGKAWVTVSGIPYRYVALEQFEMEVRK